MTVLGPNFWAGKLPEGCRLCREGAKMVVYLTGECQSHCFYCPVARDRMYVDRAFANEREVKVGDMNALIEEAKAMDAKGAGITGGDPMTKPERVIEYCTALKQAFGPSFHTHLYTQNAFEPSWLPKVKAGGLDEIRFHPGTGWWDKMASSPWATLLPAAKKAGLRAGFEVPAIPYRQEQLIQFITWANQAGAEFVNLNELEFSEANIDQLSSRGFEFANDHTNVVQESGSTARKVVEHALRHRFTTTVHFCASTYKDSVQLRKRFERRIAQTGRAFEAATPDGTLLLGVIEAPERDLDALHERLVSEFQVPVTDLAINRSQARIDIAPWILEDLQPKIAHYPCFIVEVHPTSTRLEVERTPLPYPEGDWDHESLPPSPKTR